MPNYEPNYVVGRGRLYFSVFKKGSNTPASGELYFGNTPELTLTADTETLDHYSSESGLRNLDASVLLEYTGGGNFTCDEINADNLALFFLGDKATVTQTQATGRKETITLVQQGRYYQLGTDSVTPSGVRNVNNVEVVIADAGTSISVGSGDISTIPGTTVLDPDNYEVDLAAGRIYFEPDSADIGATGKTAAVQYDVAAQARTMIIGKANMIYGSLRFISDNPVGTQKDYFFPKVSLTPDGDYALKGDDWQVMGFTFRAMKLNSVTERVYIDIRDSTVEADPATQRNITVTPAATSGTAGTAITVTVVVRDGNNMAVQGEAVTLSTVAGATVTPTSGTTNSTGQVTTQLNRTAAGTATVTATLDGGKSATSATVTFAAP
jgi:hypothetical protein